MNKRIKRKRRKMFMQKSINQDLSKQHYTAWSDLTLLYYKLINAGIKVDLKALLKSFIVPTDNIRIGLTNGIISINSGNLYRLNNYPEPLSEFKKRFHDLSKFKVESVKTEIQNNDLTFESGTGKRFLLERPSTEIIIIDVSILEII